MLAAKRTTGKNDKPTMRRTYQVLQPSSATYVSPSPYVIPRIVQVAGSSLVLSGSIGGQAIIVQVLTPFSVQVQVLHPSEDK